MATENFWENNELERKIVEVLASVTYQDPDHPYGRPFLTAYQLAILIKERFPKTFQRSSLPIGGKGSGVRYTFTSYLAGQLSRKIQNGEITNIEGGFLSNRQLVKIEFNDEGESVISSLTDSQYDLSMYRLRSSGV